MWLKTTLLGGLDNWRQEACSFEFLWPDKTYPVVLPAEGLYDAHGKTLHYFNRHFFPKHPRFMNERSLEVY